MLRKKLVSLLSQIFPETFTNIAFEKLTNPQIIKLRESEQEVLGLARQGDIPFKDFTIRTYHWPGEGEPVLLIHGWEGQAGNFADIIKRLLEAGADIHAFDAPAHGFSSKGRTSPIEFAELVAHLVERLGVRRAVSHSFGGVAISYALFQNRQLSLDRAVLITTPDRFSERIADVAEKVGVSHKVQKRLVQRMQQANIDVSKFNVSDFVRHIDVGHALILHDREDRVIPISQSRNVHRNWPQAEFLEVEGTGHFRILRTPHVIDHIVDFITARRVA